MAKRFHVSMIVEAGALYDVTAAAQRKAYNVQITPVFDSDDEPAVTAGNGVDKTSPRIAIRTVLEPWWATQKQFNIKDAIEQTTSHGGSRSAVYTATAAAVRDGLLERLAPGEYRVLPALKQHLKAGGKKPRPGATSADKGHGDFILEVLKRTGPVKRAAINAEFIAAGRPVRSSDGALHRLTQKKLIKKSSEGLWELTAKGVDQGVE